MPARKGLRPRFAVIPTNGRPCLKDCLDAIKPQVDSTILIYTTPWAEGEVRPLANTGIALRDLRPINISRWWNQGLNLAQEVMNLTGDGERYDVAVLNDDVIVPPGWFGAVSDKMREMGAAAGCASNEVSHPVFHTHAGPVPLHTRLTGFAFILAGEKGIKANEDLRWYFSDDYVDWTARSQGGMVMVPGFGVNHLYPNAQMTPEMHQMCAEDAGKFVSIWGMRPW